MPPSTHPIRLPVTDPFRRLHNGHGSHSPPKTHHSPLITQPTNQHHSPLITCYLGDEEELLELLTRHQHQHLLEATHQQIDDVRLLTHSSIWQTRSTHSSTHSMDCNSSLNINSHLLIDSELKISDNSTSIWRIQSTHSTNTNSMTLINLLTQHQHQHQLTGTTHLDLLDGRIRENLLL